MHPNTLRQRLRRIQDLTGLDVANEDWLMIEIELKLLRLDSRSAAAENPGGWVFPAIRREGSQFPQIRGRFCTLFPQGKEPWNGDCERPPAGGHHPQEGG